MAAIHVNEAAWGKDHWSVFAYIAELAKYKENAAPDKTRMRTNEKTHPQLIGCSGNVGGSKYPTQLKEGTLEGHDDWDCLDDLEHAKLLKSVGTGMFPAYKLTKKGIKIAALLYEHKLKGGFFANFRGAQ